MTQASSGQDLRANFRGQVIDRDDPRYDDARSLYNGMMNKRPAVIARCSDVADVIAAVNFGRDRGLLVAVTLLRALQHRGLKRGVAALCIGGGEATAIAIERVG